MPPRTFDLHVAAITAENYAAIYANPETRWYAQRSLRRLAPALTAAGEWSQLLHPRGRDGKFIEKFGWVRWLGDDLKWHDGWVRDINPDTGELTVKNGGETNKFANAKNLYARPKRKARLALPNVMEGTAPAGWTKIGGQGGSNPGGLFQVDTGNANNSPELGPRSQTLRTLMNLSGGQPLYGLSLKDPNIGSNSIVGYENIVSVPRLDGTKGRQDVLIRSGSNWYQVPASGSIFSPQTGLLRDDLKRTPDEVFGAPNTPRRHDVLADQQAYATTYSNNPDGLYLSVDDVVGMVQKTGSDLPGVGDKFYVKTMNIPERARNEALAGHLYELLGVPVPDVAVGTDGKTISSKILGDTVPFDPSNVTHRKAAQKGFVADVLLANWDAVGMTYDNMQVDADGNVWRIDAGGALAYRAQGKPKGAMFGTTAGELTSLRDPKINPQAALVYGDISKSEMLEQATTLAALQPADLLDVANEFDMPEIGPILVARRQNILDSLGYSLFVEPTPPPAPSPPTLNPVEHVQQMGTGPQVAVDNYWQVFASMPTESFSDFDNGAEASEAAHAEWFKNAVFVQGDGDLFTYYSDYYHNPGLESTDMLARNLFNGKIELIHVDDQTKVLADYQKNDPYLDAVVDNLAVYREMAIADIVAQAKPDSLGDLMSDPTRYAPEVPALQHAQLGILNWSMLIAANDRGLLGPKTDWPLMDAYGGVWEIEQFPAHANDDLVLKYAGPQTGAGTKWKLNSANFKNSSNWFRPSNDTTAALWKSKELPEYAEGHPWADDNAGLAVNAPNVPDVGGQHHDHEQQLLHDAHNAPGDDVPEPSSVGDDEGTGFEPDAPATGVFVKTDPTTWKYASDDEFNAAFTDAGEAVPEKTPEKPFFDADLEQLLAEEEAIADAIAAASPSTLVKTNGTVVDALGPSEHHILSTEMTTGDLEVLQTALVGQYVAILPIDALDNPDWEGKNLGTANGLGTVESVELKEVYLGGVYKGGTYMPGHYEKVVAVRVLKPNGSYTLIPGGEDSAFPKVIVPVMTQPIAQVPTFKKTGEIVINGVIVGTWTKPHQGTYGDPGYYYYSGVINGDHSLTGKPLQFHVNKQSKLKDAAGALVVPIQPKPVKPKSTKVYKTAEEIKALNAQLADITGQISGIEQQITEGVPAVPVGAGIPLADGSQPEVGDWVFSTKDGSYAQILNPAVIGFKGKGVLSPDMVKVKIQDPATGKWKQSNRKRAVLVKAAKPGTMPFVLETKAHLAKNGDWYGPGTEVVVYGDAVPSANALVLDTTTDGNAKVKLPDGTVKWLHQDYVASTALEPQLKSPPSTASAAELNAKLAELTNESNVLAAAIANTTSTPPKKKKPVGTPYPGPNGMTFNQPSYLAADRAAKGLNNLKDGYAPTVGMIVRHNDGTAYVIAEVGVDYSSHKNSVRVYPLGDSYNSKWRVVTTLVADHQTMLSDEVGDPLPVINKFETSSDWLAPTVGMLWRQDVQKGYYYTDPLTKKSEYRYKSASEFYIVAPEGKVYNIDGTIVSSWNVANVFSNSVRIGYINDEYDGPDGQTLTVSFQKHPNANVGTLQYAVIHDPNDSAGVILAAPEPDSTVNVPEAPDINGPIGPIAPVPDGVEVVTPEETPTAPDLPQFTGKDPAGTEVPHPAIVSSSAGVPAYQSSGGTTLDVAGVAGARSVMGAIGETISTATGNKKSGEKKWVSTYGLADHDLIEDMMVQTQVVRDAQGNEFVEVRFRMEHDAARANHNTFITSSVNQNGDWEFANRNATNLVAGDLLAVRVSGGGGVTTSGALRPDGGAGEGKTPNATVTGPATLIGKNKAGTYDVWRTPVVTANGDSGWIDLEDRDGADTVATAYWDATKPRQTNGAKSLNPNASNDGWSVKRTGLDWERSQSTGSHDERYADAVKKVGGPHLASAGSGSSAWTLQRDYAGAHIEYQTSTAKNSNDGRVMIRVPVGDPEAQRKISEAMELVGVSKKAQAPPDKAALTKMATNKVWEQFNPVYTRGKRPNSPDEALTAIDKAVGTQLGRKATLDDISLRISDDGRVQVLVSEDVARAVVARNGVRAYTHNFASAGMTATIEGAMLGEHPGLMATTERWSHGMFFFGMSSIADHGHDSADHLFLRMTKDKTTSQSGTLIFDPVAIHRHVDYYWQPSDSYGERQSDQLNWLTPTNTSGSNELMIQRRLEADLWGHIVLSNPERSQTIAKLKAKGVTHAPNGMLLEDFFVGTGGAGMLPPQPPPFGTEIPITSLPDPAPVPVGV